MKKAVITGQRQAGLVDTPEPQPIENWVVVKLGRPHTFHPLYQIRTHF